MDQSDFMLPRLRHLASKITKLDYKLRRDISVRDLEDGQFSTSGSPGTVLPKIVAGCISCTFLQQETQESEHFRLGISTNERNLIMTLASLQDRTVLRDLICDISQQCFNKLREQVSGVDLGNLMTPSLLSAQLIMQSALHQIPRVRPVLDDIMLHDIGVLVRKIVVELIENEEGSFDGALKVSDALKGCNYLEAAGIWQIKFILRSAGLEDDAVAIRAVPDIIIWGTALAKQVALGILNSPLRLQRKSRNQELDLQDDNVLLIDDVNGNSIDAIPISQEVVEQNVDSPPSPRLSRPKPKKGRKSRPISRKK